MSKAPDLSPQIAALASDDSQAVLTGLTSLLTADVRGYPQNEQQALNMSSKVLVLLSSSNAGVRMGAARLAARMAQQLGVLPSSMRSDAFLEALWSLVSEFGSKFTAYKQALVQAEQAAAQAEATKKPGAKAAAAAPAAPADLEAALPVPSKQCLEATLRCLTSLASVSSVPTAWMARNCCVELLLKLLQHHSPRVQLRALLCLKTLCSSQELCSQLLMQGMVQDLMRLLHRTACGAVLISATQLLLHLCQQGPGPQLIQIIDAGAVHTLLQLLLSPESVPVQKPAAAAAAADLPDAPAQPSPAAVDFIMLASCKPTELQVAAAALLHHLASFNLEASAQLQEAGGLNLLLAMLPSAPKAGSKELPSTAAPDPAPITPFFPPPAAPQDENPEAAAAEGSAAAQVAAEPGVLERMAHPLPTSKAGSHQLQAYLLDLVSLLLAGAEVQQAVWQASERSPLIPLLTYFLSEPEPSAEPTELEPTVSVEAPTKGGKGAKEAKGKPVSAKSAKAGAAAEPVPSTVDVSQPPFPSPVKVAALHCLTQLAQHPGLAATMSTEDCIKALIPAGSAAARINPSSRAPQKEPTDAAPAPGASLPLGAPLAEAAATLLQVLLDVETDSQPQPLASHKDIVNCAKGLAATTRAMGSLVAQSNAVRMVLLLPEADLIAPARPPPPSPPKTPPPLPLATSQFVWDALGRPSMTDGSNVKLVHVA